MANLRAAPPNWTLARPDTWEGVIDALYDYIERPHAHCNKSVRVGGQPDYKTRHFDGYKWVCLDPELGMLETDRCLIYSFGVDHDWSFDDNAQLLECEIHAFDPSIGATDHKRSARIFFHNIGIGGRNEVKTVRRGLVSTRRWDIRTYEGVVRFLGHLDRTVHYLKVDVEGSEWDMFAQIFAQSPHLLRNVKQIGMEVHMAFVPSSKVGLDMWKRYLSTFMQLERMGFRLFHSEVNPYEAPRNLFKWTPRKVSRVYELVWLNQPW
ncbi:methyltransferase-like protein 24 [Pollicipes pollicipes]|uniref:methyltransferase-like protein 24 n=1 Tax=Pollicipes pollicipes TaxID=41117 RepID=UPI001884B16E|nr:methyltransferase-like protein 24 [Pollicipes pollicipes]